MYSITHIFTHPGQIRESLEYMFLMPFLETGQVTGSTIVKWLKIWTLVSDGLEFKSPLFIYSLCGFEKIERQGNVGGGKINMRSGFWQMS